jgi:hypothetical protein
MWFKQAKIPLITFIANLLFTLLMAVSFWNSIRHGRDPGAWPLIFLFLSIISAALFYTLYLKATDKRITENLISEKLAEERARILGEMNKKEEVNTNNDIKIDERAGEIIPRGTFKTAEAFATQLLTNIASELEMVLGILYLHKGKGNTFSFLSGYALASDQQPSDFKTGENLNGQVAQNKEIMVLRDLPEHYFTVESGLGSSKPGNLIIAPLVNKNKTVAIIEIATFIDIDVNTELLVQKICSLAADKLVQF